MEHFTPYSALAGGALIGIAASIFLWMNGAIAGISGILGGLVSASRDNVGERILFLIGLILGNLLYRFIAADAPISIETPLPALLVAGMMVGYGTRLGSGCTSGHGICGIARVSPRSIVATAVFMATGAFTVFVIHHVIGGAP